MTFLKMKSVQTFWQKREYIYPYDCMNTFDKFDEEQRASKEQIYSRLSKEDITHGDYKKTM